MERVRFNKTKISGGFWKQKQDMVINTTAMSVYERFSETGRFRAFDFDWKEGMPDKPHFFWDSDVAKWIEGIAYIIYAKRSPELEKIVDELVDKIEKNQSDDGYFNIYFTVVEPQNRFKKRSHHELYCAGHLIEASVAYYEATGKDKFLRLMKKYADYIQKRFMTDRDTDFITPGHEEIELALVRLYECTAEKHYLELAKFFIDMRGNNEIERAALYDQTDLPVKAQKDANGHAVRAVYLYCGMADIARQYGDRDLLEACRRVFDSIINKRMYITGGIGSSSSGEAFTIDYDLPNIFAYTETCAALGLALFAHRMLLSENNRKYSDIIERIIYNGFLSGISLNGDSFFYENPLELIPRIRNRNVSHENSKMHFPITQRKKIFDCSCCPPNIVRFIPSIAEFLYTASEKDNTVFVHQFMESESTFNFCGAPVYIKQKTNYPYDGRVSVTYHGKAIKLAVRVPAWCEEYVGAATDGYAYFDIDDNTTIDINFPMKAVFIEASPEVEIDCGRYAIMYGPLVYCMEEADNGKSLRDITIDSESPFEAGIDDILKVPTLAIKAFRRKSRADLYQRRTNDRVEVTARFIPYFAFANRGEGEMLVFCSVK